MGCDTGSTPLEQAPRVEKAKSQKSQQQVIALESASGMQAELSYANAGAAAPHAVFTGADGRDVRISDFAGRPVLVNIWATWCAPCKAEMPTLDALASLEEGTVTVVAVSQDLQGRNPVRQYFASADIVNLEPYTDTENRLSQAYGVGLPLPMTILFDSNGQEVWRVSGGVEWDDAEIAKLLREAT